MVNKDMNGFPVKKCSAFQFFKKRVRRWIKSPVVSVEKHPHTSLKYPGSTVMHLPPGDSELEPPLCQTCLSDHPFQRGIAPQEAEASSWESQRSSKAKEPHSKGDSLPKPEPRPLWGGEEAGAKGVKDVILDVGVKKDSFYIMSTIISFIDTLYSLKEMLISALSLYTSEDNL
ncbi:hypothetical protein AV530_005461 [Patagioenas fasciata monilis]|uniref:Uncharacterized protein n=1 Tax=Patagioenas fasciata monilis TaxID=372326 RepID=A0A1V4JLH2_PATFA|nr:hypothetical protein AV530_005461 [Patagioenas fasciata monilis]